VLPALSISLPPETRIEKPLVVVAPLLLLVAPLLLLVVVPLLLVAPLLLLAVVPLLLLVVVPLLLVAPLLLLVVVPLLLLVVPPLELLEPPPWRQCQRALPAISAGVCGVASAAAVVVVAPAAPLEPEEPPPQPASIMLNRMRPNSARGNIFRVGLVMSCLGTGSAESGARPGRGRVRQRVRSNLSIGNERDNEPAGLAGRTAAAFLRADALRE
jgi:hypothetical protein